MWVNVLTRREFISLKQLEYFSYHSANDTSKNIRAVLYGIIVGKEFESVKEYDRESTSCNVMEKVVKIPRELQNYGNLPSVDDIRQMSKEDAKKLLLASLGQTETVSHESLQLPMAVTRYWFHEVQSEFLTCIAHGLLAGIILYTEEKNMMEVFCKEARIMRELPHSIYDVRNGLDIRHELARWQSCLIYANDLNVLLNEPLPKFDISKLFSGRITHRLAELVKEKKGSTFNRILEDHPSFNDKFQELWRYVKAK